MYLEKAESVTERSKCFRLKTVFKDQWYSPLKLDKKPCTATAGAEGAAQGVFP